MKQLSFFNKIILGLNFLVVLTLLVAYFAVYIDPVTFWPFAFFGLGYPFLILLNLVFIIYWIFAAKRWFLLSLLAIIGGYGHLGSYFQLSFMDGPNSESSQKLKVMSYNVRLFDLYNWSSNKETRNRIFDLLKAENADITCFQEFFYSEKPGYFSTRDTLTEIQETRYYHDVYTHHVTEGHHFGIATFSRHPIVNKGTIRFHNDINNLAIFSDIKTSKDTIRVYNVHLSSIRSRKLNPNKLEDSKKIFQKLKTAFIKRSSQVKKVVNHLKQSPYPVILCGDFNDTPVSYSYQQVNDELNDAFVGSGNGMGRTYIGNFPSYRIDYIFHSEDLHSYDFETLPQEYSDHLPVQCVVELRD